MSETFAPTRDAAADAAAAVASGYSRMVAVPGAELYTTMLGSGIPMLILHGSIGLDQSYLREWLDPLGSVARLVYFDQRDNGRSRETDPDRPYDIRTFVHDAEALRQQLDLDRVVVFGHSNGGRIAQEYALTYPSRVAGLILCGTDARVDYFDAVLANARARGTPEQLGALDRALSQPFASDEEWEHAFKAILPLYFHRPQLVDSIRSFDRVRYRARAFMNAVTVGMAQFDTRDRLGGITAPTLVLAGADDWITPLAQATEPLAAAIPGAELVVFQESGHNPFIEEHARFLRVVRSWLDHLSQRRPLAP